MGLIDALDFHPKLVSDFTVRTKTGAIGACLRGRGGSPSVERDVRSHTHPIPTSQSLSLHSPSRRSCFSQS